MCYLANKRRYQEHVDWRTQKRYAEADPKKCCVLTYSRQASTEKRLVMGEARGVVVIGVPAIYSNSVATAVAAEAQKCCVLTYEHACVVLSFK